MFRPSLALLLPTLVVGCAAQSGPEVLRFDEPPLAGAAAQLPDGLNPSACVGGDGELASDGADPADASGMWFEIPCPDQMTPDFVASLQRALAVRGHYSGPVTGQVNSATRDAVRAYQRENGLDSDVLSLAAAKRLGLIAYSRAELGGEDEVLSENGAEDDIDGADRTSS